MASFDAAAWAPADCSYGLLHLLICREVLLHEALSVVRPANGLKALDASLCSPVLQPLHREAPPPMPDAEMDDFDDDASYISEGEPFEPSELVAWGKGHRGAWWRVRPALREEVVIRSGVSLASAETRRAAPGEAFQQKGKPRVVLEGRAQGCIRMPIQPDGWVTADASRAGGPQFLFRVHAPRWKVIYPGDVVVRALSDLHSEALASLSCGEIVEQAGPTVQQPDGIVRMPITTGGASRICGWVTMDATSAGGPVLFKLVPDVDSPAKGHGRGGSRKK